MIYCVWYPSGGFGHYINSILNLHGKNFVRPAKSLSFSKDGNSHDLDYVAPRYFQDQDHYEFDFDPNHNYSVIVDNGILNEGTKFTKFFPQSTIIKMCYSDFSFPVVFQTIYSKVMKKNINYDLRPGNDWETSSDWALREKYFLSIRDSMWRHSWKPDSVSHPIHLEDLVNYDTLVKRFNDIGVEVDDFSVIHNQWWAVNQKYFMPVLNASKFINGEHLSAPITDIWTQAVVYFQIWCKYGIEVPHNDFENFFDSQDQYQDWLKSVL